MSESNLQLVFAAITPIVDAFEQLGVEYHIGGSVASSAHGIIRATIDADLVAVLQYEHVRPLVKLLENTYYIDADAVRDAIRRKSSFNAIHLDTMLKVDIFIPKARLFDQEELSRDLFDLLSSETKPQVHLDRLHTFDSPLIQVAIAILQPASTQQPFLLIIAQGSYTHSCTTRYFTDTHESLSFPAYCGSPGELPTLSINYDITVRVKGR